MVTMKLDSTGIDPNKKSGFEPYEGPLPTPGVYAATIVSCKIRVSQAGNPYFNVGFEFADQTKAEKQKFKGYVLWDKITPGDSDFQKERVGKLLHTVCGKVKANVSHEPIEEGGKVDKIGGKEPVGTRCRVTVRRGTFNGEPVCELADLFPWPKGEEWPEGDVVAEDEEPETEEVDEDEADEEEDVEVEEDEEEEDEELEDEEEEDDSAFEDRQAELREMDRTTLKSTLKSLDPDFRVLKKHSDEDLANAILDLEFPVEDAEDEEEGDDEPPF